jgi:hypothetical protein
MKLSRICFLLLLLFLLVPSVSYAQTKTANKSWNAFWTKFSAAVNKKNHIVLKSLMASEKDFFSGGNQTPDEWLQGLKDEKNYCSILQKSVRLGTEPDKRPGVPTCVTKDEKFGFRFIGGRWRFMGPWGD